MILPFSSFQEALNKAGISSSTLIRLAAQGCAEAFLEDKPQGEVLILCGKGIKGRIGLALAEQLHKKQVPVHACLVNGLVKTKKEAAGLLISEKNLASQLQSFPILIDAVLGGDEAPVLSSSLRHLFQSIRDQEHLLYAVDLNSGADPDSDAVDPDALPSQTTWALGTLKITHLFRREHPLFQKLKVIPLPLKESDSMVREMNEDVFFQNFPGKSPTAWKGSHGKILLINGCMGMAGAAMLNILGARTLGASYILDALPEEIYPIAASRFITPVYHPFTDDTWHEVIEPLLEEARAVGFGSGAVYMPHKLEILDLVLQNARGPIVLDGEALRMLKYNTFILRFAKAPVILTPHIGEFLDFCGMPREKVEKNRVEAALRFAQDYHVTLVLKGADTIAASPHGCLYVNQSGSPALAQAGSGDVLTGMLTALLSMTADVFTAVTMAVWLHGYLAQLGTEDHAVQTFDLTRYPQLMDALFKKHGL